MKYLGDSCIFIHIINTGSKILNITEYCKRSGDKVCITNIVMDELTPPKHFTKKESDISNDRIMAINNCARAGYIDIININVNHKFYENFKKIRKRYYEHLEDPASVLKLVESGDIKPEELLSQSYQYKDYGECSCIAVAMEYPDDFIIITEDKGRVFCKPSVNLFERYKVKKNIKVWSYNEWKKNIEYNDDDSFMPA